MSGVLIAKPTKMARNTHHCTSYQKRFTSAGDGWLGGCGALLSAIAICCCICAASSGMPKVSGSPVRLCIDAANPTMPTSMTRPPTRGTPLNI